ncbi:MAG: pyridoxal-phosphate dependent enzyme [Pseudomonadales bacterium]
MQPIVYQNSIESIGNTPMLKVTRIDTGPCELYLKLENQNPGGSIKDRIGKSMIEAAIADGKLKPGGTLIAATAGNTGLGLALVASQLDYPLILVVPDKMAQEKIYHLKALGTDVRLTRSDVGKGHPEYYQDVAERLAREIPNAIYVNQFDNPANPLAHETGTGPEIWVQMEGRLDAMVCGVGSGGTLTGLGRFFKRVAPNLEMVLADPEGSILAEYIRTGKISDEVGSWLVEGIGEDFIPPVSDLSYTRHAYTVSDADAFAAARELLSKEGIIAGSSSGTLLAAALRYCREQTEPKRVATFVCDSGNKYLSKLYNDFWMRDQGFIEREEFGDLRDVISRPHDDRDTVVAAPNDTLLSVLNRMKLYDISQLPVMDDQGSVIGLVDESDILYSVVNNAAKFSTPVEAVMTKRLQTLSYKQPISDLVPLFEKDMVAIITDGDSFLGLITRIDLLNYLRRKVNK